MKKRATFNWVEALKSHTTTASAPCRIDMGGTLDIRTFHEPLRDLSPSTFNIAINLRTRVKLQAHQPGSVKISSRGFESAEFGIDAIPEDHPLGLMFTIATFFGADGVHIRIDSASPPKSALGGSSVAAVALMAAFKKVTDNLDLSAHSRKAIALRAHALEERVAGVPCGIQDQLAAVFGGVNAWHWQPSSGAKKFRRTVIIRSDYYKKLASHILLAYCGIPHESKNINQRWIEQFTGGGYQKEWAQIVEYTNRFNAALMQFNIKQACDWMRREVAIRRQLTPDVFDSIGKELVATAVDQKCSARFTGAGGGGCLWALGERENIDRLRHVWDGVLSQRAGANRLDFQIDPIGLKIEP